jgi:hypothetical protein
MMPDHDSSPAGEPSKSRRPLIRSADPPCITKLLNKSCRGKIKLQPVEIKGPNRHLSEEISDLSD